MYIVNILTKSESGLAVDADILASALPSPEFMVRRICTDMPRHERMLDRIKTHWTKFRFGNRRVINLHCEQIRERYLAPGDFNVLIPNQEWLWPGTMELITKMDAIFCKTRYASEIYQRYGKTLFIGFSSPDREDASVAKDYSQFLHLAGKSKQKGTRILANVWSRHPEWPTLNLVSRREGLIDDIEAANINKIQTLTPAQLQELQNRCGLHLCPSEAEGYGHSIGEGMSTGALMLTTDAPPMHELVESSRGVLVAFDHQSEQGLGSNYYVDEVALEHAIQQIITMGLAEKEGMSRAARQWFIENRKVFAGRLQQALRTLASPSLGDNKEGQESKCVG